MKTSAYFFLLFICSLLLSSCNRSKFSLHSNAPTQNEILSKKIESDRENTTYAKIKEAHGKTYSETLLKEQKTTVSSNPQRNIGLTKTSERERYQKKTAAVYKVSAQKPVSDFPIDLKKHDNVLWKLGGIICMTGMAFSLLGLAILLKATSGPYTVWIVGILIGLGLMVISIPLLLMGAAMDSGNNNNNQEQNKTE